MSKSEAKSEVIHASVWSPNGFHLFKTKANDRAQAKTISCSMPSCPLLADGQCHMIGGLFGRRCPYGNLQCETGPTKRSSKLSAWEREKRAQYASVPWLKSPAEKMCRVGDYMLLPYSHMTEVNEVPFRHRASLGSEGDPFLPLDNWTIETVLLLIHGRPQALFGGEITSYQKESVPKFLQHLRELEPEMWGLLIEKVPRLDVEANYVGRKAELATLTPPFRWTETSSKGEYPVVWTWDGETLTTDSMAAYHKTWGSVVLESVSIQAKPADGVSIVVRDNAWVNQDTKFTD